MKKILCFVLVVYLSLSLSVYGEVKHNYKAAVLIETNTGKILYEYNKDKLLPQASITKLMTYYTFKEYLRKNSINENSKVTIEKDTFNIPSDGVKLGLKKNDVISIEDLINTMLIISANDSASEIEDIYNKNCGNMVKAMNANCSTLGLTQSHFINSDGITVKNGNTKTYNTTTAYEIAKLANIILKKYPEIIKTTSKREYVFNKKLYYNTNLLLKKFKTIDGMKTGHTDEAGYCLVSTENVTSKIGNGKYTRLLAVVLGCSSDTSRMKESTKLLKYAESNFVNEKLATKNKEVKLKADYYKGGYISGAVAKDIYLLKNKNAKSIKIVKLKNQQMGTIHKGDIIGSFQAKVGTQTISAPIYAQHDFNLKPWYIRLLISIVKFFQNLF